MAERLARAGHKVVVVEQTETPDMLAARNELRRSKGLKKVRHLPPPQPFACACAAVSAAITALPSA